MIRWAGPRPIIFIDDRDGYFVLPSEKAYWKAAPAEIVDKFLGLPSASAKWPACSAAAGRESRKSEAILDGMDFEA